MAYAARRLEEIKQEEMERAASQPITDMQGPVLRPQPDDSFTVAKEKGIFVVRGKRVERLVNMTNQESEEGMARLEMTLEKMGVIKALQEAEVQEGDLVRVGKVEFYWGD